MQDVPLPLPQNHADAMPAPVPRSQVQDLSPPASTSRWSHYLVLDFEATCAENDPTQKQWSEIIEFPAVLIDAHTHETVAAVSYTHLTLPTKA